MFSVLDEKTLLRPTDIDRIGTLHVYNKQNELSPLYNNSTVIYSELNFHNCTIDEIKKLGKTA